MFQANSIVPLHVSCSLSCHEELGHRHARGCCGDVWARRVRRCDRSRHQFLSLAIIMYLASVRTVIGIFDSTAQRSFDALFGRKAECETKLILSSIHNKQDWL